MIQSHQQRNRLYTNLLFGEKEDLEVLVEGQVQTDDHLKLIQDELKAEINFTHACIAVDDESRITLPYHS